MNVCTKQLYMVLRELCRQSNVVQKNIQLYVLVVRIPMSSGPYPMCFVSFELFCAFDTLVKS